MTDLLSTDDVTAESTAHLATHVTADVVPPPKRKKQRMTALTLQKKNVEDLKQMGADMPDGMSAALQGLVYDGPSLAAPVLERDLAFLDRLLLAAATQSVNGVSSQVS